MASQVDLSATGFQRLRQLLTPKHLQLAPAKRKQQFRDKFLQETPAQIIKEGKLKFMKPLSEIQTIMRHFDAKFEKTTVQEGHGKRRGNSLLHPSDKKMKQLISLPSLKVIKERAKSYRNALNAEEINQRNDRKQKIMDQFSAYLHKELKSNPTSSNRLNTVA